MKPSTILTFLSSVAAIEASAIQLQSRNENHISMYSTDACNNNDKYYKWEGAATCNCIEVDSKAASVYTDMEPLQDAIAFSDGNCKTTLGHLGKQKCTQTDTAFEAGAIGSVMFWLPGVCDVEAALSDIVKDVEKALAAA